MSTSPRTSRSAGGWLDAQPERDRADRAQVRRDVLADVAVAARRRPHEHAVLVAQADREPVELELGGVLDRARRPELQLAADAPVEGGRPAGAGTRSCGATASAPCAAPRGRSLRTAPPTRWVGESGVASSGYASSSSCSSRNSRSYSASGSWRRVERVVLVVGALDLLAQRLDARGDVLARTPAIMKTDAARARRPAGMPRAAIADVDRAQLLLDRVDAARR